MSKSIFQDMIKINQGRRPLNSEEEKWPEVSYEDARRSTVESSDGEVVTPRKRHRTLWLVAVIAVIFFLFALSYLFSKAVVEINPKTENFILENLGQSNSISASLDEDGEDLSFDLVVISGEESITVPASEQKEVLQSAKGTVIIYNAFSSVAQRLDIDTRLEGSNGKIYKTTKALTVPGMKDDAPGSVEVAVYAVLGGEDYNSGPLDFKIFGFKGTPKYEKFYARSKGDISGGFKGRSHVVSLEDKAKADLKIKDALKAKLFQKATDQIPKGFVLFKDAVFLDIDEGEGVDLLSSSDTSTITQKGTLYGILLDEEKLTKKIAQNIIKKYDGSDVYVSHLKDMTFALSDPIASLKDAKNINFNLAGQEQIVWKPDIKKLRADLPGRSKKDFNQILLQYKNIDSAQLSLRPAWNRSFPNDIDDIKITVNYPE